MIRRGSILAVAAALVAIVSPPANAAGGCYRTEPAVSGSTTSCVVSGPGRYAVVAATQWELRVYRGGVCTGSPADIDSSLTRTGRTPSAGSLDFGAAGRCVALNPMGSGGPSIMAVDAS
jgi:hypothetical protein